MSKRKDDLVYTGETDENGNRVYVREIAKTQATRAGKGGVVPPVERQFGKPNGNKQGRGFWKIEDTGRYKLEQMFKLDEDELKAVIGDKSRPLFERKLAMSIAKGDWKTIESMFNQVYGYPKQPVEKTELEPPKPLSPRKQRKFDKE